MKKIAMVVFNGEPMCFIHVLLNALDFKAKEYQCRIIVEGAATQLIPLLASQDHPMHQLWTKVKDAGLVEGVCRACAKKMGALDAARDQGLNLLDELNGHPSMARLKEEGCDIITF